MAIRGGGAPVPDCQTQTVPRGVAFCMRWLPAGIIGLAAAVLLGGALLAGRWLAAPHPLDQPVEAPAQGETMSATVPAALPQPENLPQRQDGQPVKLATATFALG
jgi:hypothetical protein